MTIAIEPNNAPAPVETGVIRTGIQITDDVIDGVTRTKGIVSGYTVDAQGAKVREITAAMSYDEYDNWDATDAYATTILLTKNGLVVA